MTTVDERIKNLVALALDERNNSVHEALSAARKALKLIQANGGVGAGNEAVINEAFERGVQFERKIGSGYVTGHTAGYKEGYAAGGRAVEPRIESARQAGFQKGVEEGKRRAREELGVRAGPKREPVTVTIDPSGARHPWDPRPEDRDPARENYRRNYDNTFGVPFSVFFDEAGVAFKYHDESPPVARPPNRVGIRFGDRPDIEISCATPGECRCSHSHMCDCRKGVRFQGPHGSSFYQCMKCGAQLHGYSWAEGHYGKEINL